MHLPGGGLSSEEVMVEGAVSGVEPGLQEDAAVGDGLQGSRALVGKTKADEKLDKKKRPRRR